MLQKQNDVRVNDPVDPGGNDITLKLPGFVIFQHA
jgi:hypothetical protein